MPCRKNIKPPSKFSFVSVDCEGNDRSWLKLHSGATRSHAAYWGGSGKHQPQSKRQDAGEHRESSTSVPSTNKCSLTHNGEPSESDTLPPRYVRRIKKKQSKAVFSPTKARSQSPRHFRPNDLSHLPSLPSWITAANPQFSSCLSMFEFCGDNFVRRFVMLDHEDYSIMSSGYLLLSYAHWMALTGRGTKAVLLDLKSQVIRSISRKIKCSDGLLSPWLLTAVLALGAPIVCLVSHDLPRGMSIGEYVTASMQDCSLCCQEAAVTANEALDERIMHRQALDKLFLKSRVTFLDPDSTALLHYVSNCVNM